jgi:hypothetical protein
VQYEDDVVLSDEIITVRDKVDAAVDGSRAANETYISLILKMGQTLRSISAMLWAVLRCP